MTANRAQNITAPVTIEMPNQTHKRNPFSLNKAKSTHAFHSFQITEGQGISLTSYDFTAQLCLIIAAFKYTCATRISAGFVD